LTHDHAKRIANTIDNAQKTIEHPTDVEDAHDEFDGQSDDFEHINNSPDIKLKSIEIDDEFRAQRNNNGHLEDKSGTGHKASSKSSRVPSSQKSSLINQYSYGAESAEYQ